MAVMPWNDPSSGSIPSHAALERLHLYAEWSWRADSDRPGAELELRMVETSDSPGAGAQVAVIRAPDGHMLSIFEATP